MGNKNKLIVKSNYIVEASYKLSLGEQRVIYVLTSMINSTDDEFKPYKLTVKEFTEILGTKSKDMYNQVSRYVEGLRDRDLTIIKEKSILKTKWLSSAEYFIDDGYVELCFDPKLKPYLLMLKERFTKLSLDQMVSFSSQYHGRIYELLKQYEKIGERIFKLDDLKSLLGIGFDEYAQYGLFKQRILSKSKDEINKNSDIDIDFEEIKIGRKVTSIKFYMKSNNPKTLNVDDEVSATLIELKEETPIKKIMELMSQHKITELEAKKIYDSSKSNIDHISKVYEYIKTRSVNNIVAFMIKVVKPGEFQEPKSSTGKPNSVFHNFEQRTYDYDKLERELLGWDKAE